MPSTGNVTADIIIYIGALLVVLLFGGLMWFINSHFADQKSSIEGMSSKFDRHSQEMEEQRNRIFNISLQLHKDLEDHRKLNKVEQSETIRELAQVRKEAVLLEATIEKSNLSMQSLAMKTEVVDKKVDVIGGKTIQIENKLSGISKSVEEVTDRVNKSLIVLKRHDDTIKEVKSDIHKINDNLILIKGNKK